MPRGQFGVPPLSKDVVSYADFKWNMVPTVDAPRDPTVLDTNYPVQTIWRNSITFSECILTGFDATGALWSCFTAGSGNITSLRADDGNVVMPLAGVIDVDGETVASLTNAKPLFSEGVTANTLKLQLQVGRARTGAPGNKLDAGIVSFDDTQFAVNADGYVTFIGSAGGSVNDFDVQFATGPGTDPVVPNGAGTVFVNGAVVASGTNAATPVATHSRAANTYNLEVQLTNGTSSAPGNNNLVGLSQYDLNHFLIQSNAWVQAKASNVDTVPGLYNMGMFYSSPTVTLSGANGSALSASNPAILTMKSNVNPGQLVHVDITSDITFEDAGGTSIFAGSLFGFVTGDDTAAGGGNPIPFYLYVSLDNTDANPVFWISRIPNLKIFTTTNCFNATSGSADLAANGLTVTSVTLANYNNSYVQLVGTFDAALNGSDDWVVQNVDSAALDLGIGRYAEKARNFPRGCMGARAGSYFQDNGGTAPTINTSAQFPYLITKDGRFFWDLSFGITSTPTGDVEARLIRPIVGQIGTTLTVIGTWASEIAGMHVNKDLIAIESVNTGGATEHFFFNKCDGSATRMQYSELKSNDILRAQISYLL